MMPPLKAWFLSILVLCPLLVGCATVKGPKKAFPVTLEVDFGPAQRTPIHKVFQVEQGATAKTLLAQLCPVETGSVCCDPREVAVIDGVATDPATNRWWTVAINGSKKVSPFKTRLKPGDQVVWSYRQHDQ